MRKIDIIVPIIEYTYDELSAEDRRLVDMAREATYRSYVPYSHFHVGAAIELDNGEMIPLSRRRAKALLARISDYVTARVCEC